MLHHQQLMKQTLLPMLVVHWWRQEGHPSETGATDQKISFTHWSHFGQMPLLTSPMTYMGALVTSPMTHMGP